MAAATPSSTADDLDRGRRRPTVGGTALGSAVHAVLELVDLAGLNPDDPSGPDGLTALARRCAAEFGATEAIDEVEARSRDALGSPTLRLAARVPHHRELYVAGTIGDTLVEGFVDLCLETDEGLLVVDYKTDRLASPVEASVAAKLADYRLQGATYAVLLERITGRPVVGCRFLFLTPDGVIEADLDDLDRAKDEVLATV